MKYNILLVFRGRVQIGILSAGSNFILVEIQEVLEFNIKRFQSSRGGEMHPLVGHVRRSDEEVYSRSVRHTQ